MKTASIQDLKLMQAFAMVFLSKDLITSLILGSRFSVLLQGFKLALNPETPNEIQTKLSQSVELGGQISFSNTSVRLSLSQSCVLLLLWAGTLSCWKM